jgi:hypothetical protein
MNFSLGWLSGTNFFLLSAFSCEVAKGEREGNRRSLAYRPQDRIREPMTPLCRSFAPYQDTTSIFGAGEVGYGGIVIARGEIVQKMSISLHAFIPFIIVMSSLCKK